MTTVDGCAGCGGIWFDYQELNALTRDPAVALTEVESAFHQATSGALPQGDNRCPGCEAKLYGFSFPHTPDITLDACPLCKGIWVDDGELQKIADRVLASTRIPGLGRR